MSPTGSELPEPSSVTIALTVTVCPAPAQATGALLAEAALGLVPLEQAPSTRERKRQTRWRGFMLGEGTGHLQPGVGVPASETVCRVAGPRPKQGDLETRTERPRGVAMKALVGRRR